MSASAAGRTLAWLCALVGMGSQCEVNPLIPTPAGAASSPRPVALRVTRVSSKEALFFLIDARSAAWTDMFTILSMTMFLNGLSVITWPSRIEYLHPQSVLVGHIGSNV